MGDPGRGDATEHPPLANGPSQPKQSGADDVGLIHPVRGPLATLFVALGWLCIGLGVLGAMLPVLPTTPFILLAGYLFARSSPRFHRWILGHRLFGPMIRDWRSGLGLTVRTKVIAVSAIVLSISLSIYLVPLWWVRALLVVVAFCVSTYLIRLPTRAVTQRTRVSTG